MNLPSNIQVCFVNADLLEYVSVTAENLHELVGNLLVILVVNRQENRFNTIKFALRQEQRHTRLNSILPSNVIRGAHCSAFFGSSRIHTDDNGFFLQRWVAQFLTLREKIIQINEHHNSILHGDHVSKFGSSHEPSHAAVFKWPKPSLHTANLMPC